MKSRGASVVLVNPPITREQREGPLGPVIRNLYFNSPPLGIAYIAALLEREKVPVQVFDAAVENWTMEETVERIRATGADVVGLTSTTNFFGNALDLARRLKAADPDAFLVVGGPHASSNPERVMEHACFDVVCIGEGEYAMLELVRALASGADVGGVQGLAFRRDGRVVFSGPRPLLEDLNDLPMPARHLLPLHKYVPQPNDGPYLPKTAMISSRGCPYLCTFCDHGIFGNKYRTFSAVRIVDEMEELVTRHGIRDIAFVDSLFMVSRRRVNDIVDEILRRGLRVHWTCTIRANVADREILARMKSAGCWRVRIGVEAGDPEVLKLIRKDVSLDQVRSVVRAADELGLHPKGFFMVGHIGETRGKIEKSIALSRELPLTDITVQINTPLPGAPQWNVYEKYGKLISTDLAAFSFWEPVFVPNGMTREELQELHRRFYRAFYLRPIIVWRHLKMLRGPSDIRRYARALSLLVGMFIRRRRQPERTAPS